jgi:hypothetical protein
MNDTKDNLNDPLQHRSKGWAQVRSKFALWLFMGGFVWFVALLALFIFEPAASALEVRLFFGLAGVPIFSGLTIASIIQGFRTRKTISVAGLIFLSPPLVITAIDILVAIYPASVVAYLNPPEPPPHAVFDLFVGCSPFIDAHAHREFSWDDNRALKFTRLVSKNPSEDEDVTNSAHVETVEGSFSVDEAAKTVTLTWMGTSTAYRLLRPRGKDQCVLFTGPITSANLENSWFGVYKDDDGDNS